MQEIYTFVIENTHPVTPKYALLLGSTINLNGELDDPYVKIDVPESSHIQLKRELLNVEKKVNKLRISGIVTNDFKITACHTTSSGVTDTIILNIGQILSGKSKEFKIKEIMPSTYKLKNSERYIKLNALRYFLILIPPKEQIAIVMYLESEI